MKIATKGSYPSQNIFFFSKFNNRDSSMWEGARTAEAFCPSCWVRGERKNIAPQSNESGFSSITCYGAPDGNAFQLSWLWLCGATSTFVKDRTDLRVSLGLWVCGPVWIGNGTTASHTEMKNVLNQIVIPCVFCKGRLHLVLCSFNSGSQLDTLTGQH